MMLNRQLADMRRTLDTLFAPDPIEIYSVIKTTDRYGNESENRTLVDTVDGQLSNPSGSEREIIAALLSEGTENVETLRLRIPYGTDIDVGNEIETADNKVFNVIYVDSSMTFTAGTIAFLQRKTVV